jgi:trans-2,3-dihydro-3-hydroxyanthranilate isomerase
VVFEEQAGLVPITITSSAGRLRCELAAPERLSRGHSVDAATLAAAVSLVPADIRTGTHGPQEASVGLPFLVAEVADLAALGRARADLARLEALDAAGVTPEVHLYVRTTGDLDLRARMFAPLDNVPEDPATGSANAALAALLADCDPAPAGEFRWRVGQGIEMGRPSTLEVTAVKRDGQVQEARVAGGCVLVSEGEIDVGPGDAPA